MKKMYKRIGDKFVLFVLETFIGEHRSSSSWHGVKWAPHLRLVGKPLTLRQSQIRPHTA
jgi:hypothetical protein